MAAVLGLASQSSAFVVNVYDSQDCSGPAREVNVWDNTCANWMGGFQSYKPVVYGGGQQKIYLFIPGSCGNLLDARGGQWADGGDSGFQVGHCRSAGTGRVYNAIASYWSA